MQALQFLRRSPLTLLAVLLVAFGVWVASDLRTDPPPPTVPPSVSREFPAPPEPEDRVPSWTEPQVVTQDMVARLQPGMPRAEVEAVIGRPPATLVQPVTEVDGRFVYRTTYLANLDELPPATIRDISRKPTFRPAVVKTVIALDFDASQPGHPLIRVHPTAKAG